MYNSTGSSSWTKRIEIKRSGQKKTGSCARLNKKSETNEMSIRLIKLIVTITTLKCTQVKLGTGTKKATMILSCDY